MNFTKCSETILKAQKIFITRRVRITNSSVDDSLRSLTSKSTANNFVESSKNILNLYKQGANEQKSILYSIATNCGVRTENLDSAIHLYEKNKQMSHEVYMAAKPMHYFLLRHIGNQPEGIKHVCDMRAKLLTLVKNEKDKSLVSSLRRLEESARDLLTTWFCLSNLKLNRLTWESPGDIMYKIAQYEAVHPVRGLVDFKTRLGSNRRCFYLTHESLPREPLVMVHVALMPNISDSVQEIIHGSINESDEKDQAAAIYYSITSTQKGLAGIDLGNLLIKQVAATIQQEVPNIEEHSTLSPIPGFRSWLLRNLHGNSESKNVVDDVLIEMTGQICGKIFNRETARKFLIESLSKDSLTVDEIRPFKDVLITACARYLFGAKRNEYALNPVANFHLRNGAELYRLNWMGDTSGRGLTNSFGIMVNYRYQLSRVTKNSELYIKSGTIILSEQKMTDLSESTIDKCPVNIYYVDEGSTPSFSRKRSVPKIEECESLKKLRITLQSQAQDADTMISKLGSVNDIEADSMRSNIKNEIENTPGEYFVGYKDNDGKPLVPLPPNTEKSEGIFAKHTLLRFDQIADISVAERNVNLARTFTSVPNAFASCEENIQSLLMLLSSEETPDTGLFSSLVAALLDKKTPSERRYLCHKIFSCVANAEDISVKTADEKKNQPS
ncbi:unnamed protein product [Auanema sp. JU1783]|nr:unnamed protein product [Auanema sp. JU1783]